RSDRDWSSDVCSSDLFQPNRPTDPSELVFGFPEIPNSCLARASEAWLLRMMPFGMLSIKPAPNSGVGMRKLRLAVLLKSGGLKRSEERRVGKEWISGA